MSEKIFLTGGTGFLGKVVLSEILRRDLADEVILLIRPGFKGSKSAQDRFDKEIASTPCFQHLAAGWQKKIKVLEGDITQENCGVTEKGFSLLADATRLIHCAATVEFDLPLAKATELNITGTLHVLNLAKNCPQLKKAVYVSTAYVTPVDRKVSRPVYEKLVPLDFDPQELYQQILKGEVSEKNVLKQMKLPNTYTVTKCLAEHIFVQNAGILPIEIVRPSIISASWERPHVGWIDSLAAFAGIVALTAVGQHKVFRGQKFTPIDLVPVDFVSDFILERLFAAWRGQCVITHACAGITNSTTVGRAHEIVTDWYRRLPVSQQYPVNHYIGENGFKYRLKDIRHHKLPQTIYKIALKTRGESTRRVNFLRQKQRFINTGFTYFVNRPFDFRKKEDLPAFIQKNDFQADEYVRRVCSGIYQFIFKQSADQAPLLTRKLRTPGLQIKRSVLAKEYHPSVRALSQTLSWVGKWGGCEVTYDYQAINKALQQVKDPRSLVLVSAHRSYTDFLLWPLLCFSESHLGIPLPRIAAAEEFSKLPILNKVFQHCGAFYIKRGVGKADPSLRNQLSSLIRKDGSGLAQPLLFFIEGTRSRTGQFLNPKRGIMRCLSELTEEYTVLPLSLTYDRVPEQKVYLRELGNGAKVKQSMQGLLRWSKDLFSGRVQMGKIHLSCGQPVVIRKSDDIALRAHEVLGQIQRNTAVSRFHLRSFLQHHPVAHWNEDRLANLLQQKGAQIVDSPLGKAHYLSPAEESYARYQWEHYFYADLQLLLDKGEQVSLQEYLRQNWYSQQHSSPLAEVDVHLIRSIFRDRLSLSEHHWGFQINEALPDYRRQRLFGAEPLTGSAQPN